MLPWAKTAEISTKTLSQPRTYSLPEDQRHESPPTGFFSWIPAVLQTQDQVFLQKAGLDALLFLRCLRILSKMFAGLSLIVIPTLIPLAVVHGKNAQGGVQGLDRLSWPNIGPPSFYWAHLVMALLVATFVCRIIYTEMIEYIRIRQTYLASPQHRTQAFANAILVTDIPKRLLSVPMLSRLYSVFPGGVRAIWINRDLTQLSRKIIERKKMARALEAAEMKLIRLAIRSSHSRERRAESLKPRGKEPTVGHDDGSQIWQHYVDPSKRPCKRLPIIRGSWVPSIPFVGTKVDTIQHCWQELARLNDEIRADQQDFNKYPLLTSAFVQFNSQEAAYMACQSLVQCASWCLDSHFLEASPEDVK